ncbi:MAG: phosphoribosylformylglycinamidine synthase [Phycisphaerales bacterium]|nr:phosphoribosylformylglycinamidine synthase [Phycisphaerales bacterium]
MNHPRVIIVEKKKEFQIDAQKILNHIKHFLQIPTIRNLKLLNLYHVSLPENILKQSLHTIFSESATDRVQVVDLIETSTKVSVVIEPYIQQNELFFAYEYLPGQYDQRADSAMQCLQLIDPNLVEPVYTSKALIIEGVSQADLIKIKKYYINTVESREKVQFQLSQSSFLSEQPIPIVDHFYSANKDVLARIAKKYKLSISIEDLQMIQTYFYEQQKRAINELELRALDTYWSDHCRHTTFLTHLQQIEFQEGLINTKIQQAYHELLAIKKEVGREEQQLTLMEMATLYARYAKKKGYLEDLEISSEINACSIKVIVDHDGKDEVWLMQFKNETHNHPTEIEPYGGASTCLGGAIRDPLSGRSFVYQAIRVSGAGDITESIEKTLPHKLPQVMISQLALDGFSSYGNQIGLATTLVREIYHEGYKAKRMEVGAVVGAVPMAHVVRAEPQPGDIILLIGGQTGRDGIGGATGSSKGQDASSVETAGAEVQKGNPITERKIQRLFRNPQLTRLIKKCNDFGAGGITVAVGELCDGIRVYLDKIPLKYDNLTPLEIALSESQERMAVVIEATHKDFFIDCCNEENVACTEIGCVTKEPQLVMLWKNKPVLSLDRSFLNTNGATQTASVVVKDPFITNQNSFIPNPFVLTAEQKALFDKQSVEQIMLEHIKDKNVALQNGLINTFDSTIGGTTVLMPLGGKTQLTPTQCAIQKFPVPGNTTTCSLVSFGFQPTIASWSPFHGGAYAVVESVAKIIASGGTLDNIRFSFQEYFEKLNDDPVKWSKPFCSLLGAFNAQKKFNLPAIGGKDSMSGSFENINVPPTLISFAFQATSVHQIISPEFKVPNTATNRPGNYVYLIEHPINHTDYLPNYTVLIDNFNFIHQHIIEKKIVAAYALEHGGIAEGLFKMCIGNNIGFVMNQDIVANHKDRLFTKNQIGSIIVESSEALDYKHAILLGQTCLECVDTLPGVQSVADPLASIRIGHEVISLNQLIKASLSVFQDIFPFSPAYHSLIDTSKNNDLEKEPVSIPSISTHALCASTKVEDVCCFVPIFPGTNCELDTLKALEIAGGTTQSFVFRNQNSRAILESIGILIDHIQRAHIIVLPGGFSSGDEPDGSGKFIATVLHNKSVAQAIHQFLDREGLLLGICNGFQALVKSGLLPYGNIDPKRNQTASLFKNTIGKHLSTIAYTKIARTNSPWLHNIKPGSVFAVPISHGEGRYMDTEQNITQLIKNGQVATQYCNINGSCTDRANINGSTFNIEGVLSANGRIFGKMGHNERVTASTFKNIDGNLNMPLFINGINYFKK